MFKFRKAMHDRPAPLGPHSKNLETKYSHKSCCNHATLSQKLSAYPAYLSLHERNDPLHLILR